MLRGVDILCANLNWSCFQLTLTDERAYAKRGVMPTWAAQAG